MPTYEYECLACGRHVEVYQRFSDAPLTVCDVCGGQLRKVFHPAGILFKGSGFYVTDSRGKKTGAAKSGESSKEPAAAGSSKPESKESTGDSGSSSSDAKPGSATKEKSA